MQTFANKFLIWLFCIFCTCETIKYMDSVTEFKCPLSRIPMSFENYSDIVGKSAANSTKYWTTCLLPDYSCAKIKIPKRGYLFACLPDFGDIKPAFFDFFKPSGVHKVTLENYVSLSKGCSFLGHNFTDSTVTTVNYQSLTFVTELSCCKGGECFGKNWKKIWDDNDYTTGEFHPRNNMFWYTSVSISGTLFSLIVCKLTLLAYHRLKERVVIESLKTISRTLKEADDEDKIKRRSALTEMFRLRRHRKKKIQTENECTDASSHKTNSVQALIKANKK